MPVQGALAVPTPTPVAWVFGQPVSEIPADLFIPPKALKVVLQSFEGPLDLLLYLIRKQNLDVLDIPMLKITRQYLHYIAEMERAQMDLAAEYLLMAAVLIEIKTRLLLPRPAEVAESEEDPRAELARRLLVYEQMRLAAAGLDALPRAGRDFVWAYLAVEPQVVVRLPEVRVADLQQAWLAILARAKQHQHHQVSEEAVSVRARMSAILRLLQQHPRVPFEALFDVHGGAAEVVVSFIALLELIKEGLVAASQEAAFAPIWVWLPQSEALPETV